MTEVISVKFKADGRAYFFDPAGINAKVGDLVVVETARGIECATVSVNDDWLCAPSRASG